MLWQVDVPARLSSLTIYGLGEDVLGRGAKVLAFLQRLAKGLPRELGVANFARGRELCLKDELRRVGIR